MKTDSPCPGESLHFAVAGVQVERGVPLPGRPAPYTTRRAKYPFAVMLVGDSFETEKASVYSAAKKYRDRMAALGEVVVLVVRKQANGAYRCWRADPNAPELASYEARPRPRKSGRKPRTSKRQPTEAGSTGERA